MLTELSQQEVLLKNRIKYLKNKESKILRNLEEKSRLAEVHDSSRERTDNPTDLAQSQVVW
jgi:rRNA processing protein Krr1/Pno1